MYTQDELNRVPLRQYNLQITGPAWTTTFGVGVPYQILGGSWRLRFNISGPKAADFDVSLTIAGIAFNGVQSVTVFASSVAPHTGSGYTGNNTGTIQLHAPSSASGTWLVSGDVMLARKPEWME